MSPHLTHRPSHCVSQVLTTMSLLLILLLCLACGGSEAPSPDSEQEPVTVETQAALDSAVELEFWQSVKESGDADQLLAYIKRYPQGQFIELAETRLKNLGLDDPNVAGPGASDVDPVAPSPTTAGPSTAGPGTAGPSTSAPRPIEQSRSERVLSVVRRSLGRYSDPRLHIAPDIPRFKADNAASVHGMDPRDILVLYDDGFNGGGKTGFAITDRRIYWRFVSGADALYLDFRDIQSAIARKNKFVLNGYEVSTTMSGDSQYAAEVYSDLALALRDAFR